MSDNFDDDEEASGPAEATWMGTFSDICLLLLTFFILIVSMSTIQIQKFNASFSSVRDSFGGAQEQNVPSDITSQEEQTVTMELMRMREEALEAQRKTYNEIRSYINQQGVDGKIGAVFDEGIITLQVPGDVLFAQGAETLSREAESVLKTLMEVFQGERDQMINIKGYSDNSPLPAGARVKDNWELSALRAVNVLRWFVEQGMPVTRFTASGLGDLNPLFPNDSPENRAKNRRVEFVLERKVGK